MKAIDRVRNAYREKRRHIVVPEWENLDLYFGPLTVAIDAHGNSIYEQVGKQVEENVIKIREKLQLD